MRALCLFFFFAVLYSHGNPQYLKQLNAVYAFARRQTSTENVSFWWTGGCQLLLDTHSKKFILKICRRKEHDLLPRIRERKQCTTS